jgi:hypothetical protein
LQRSGGALVLEHNFVFLLDLLCEKAHAIYFIASGGDSDAMISKDVVVV